VLRAAISQHARAVVGELANLEQKQIHAATLAR
jgi:hypothetical protein